MCEAVRDGMRRASVARVDAGQGPFARLAHQILLSEGFTDLNPSHPLGGKDGGADAIAKRDGLRWAMGAYLPRGQQALKEIEVSGQRLIGAETEHSVNNVDHWPGQPSVP